MAFPRLPFVGGDNNAWGLILNTWLSFDHLPGGANSPAVATSGVLIDPSVNKGDVVYLDSTSFSYKLALADGSIRQQVVGLVRSLDTTAVVLFGVTDTTATVTPGIDYYLSSSIPGGITSTKPLSNIVRVGTGLTSSTLLVTIEKVETLDTSSYFPVRTFGTPYQPNTSYPTLVTVSLDTTATITGAVAKASVAIDSTSPPATVVGTVGILNGVVGDRQAHQLIFTVQKGNYYQVTKTETNGFVVPLQWVETTLKV